MTKKISLIAVAVLAAASLSANALDWNQDAVAQAGAQGVKVLQAQPLGGAVINHQGNDWDETLELTINNDGDRVGVEYTTCDPATEHNNEYPATCEYLEFVLPGVSIQGKNIVWNDAVIGRIKKGFFVNHVKLAKGCKLRALKQAAVIDRGFDRDHVAQVTVVLQAPAN